MRDKKVNLIEVIFLAAGIIALITTGINCNTAPVEKKIATQGEEITKHQNTVEAVKEKADAFRLTIDSPKEGDTIVGDSYNDMRGTFEGDIQKGYGLWVLARDQYNFFLMYPPTHVIRKMGQWSQTNIRLSTSGQWELHVCLADEKASKWFQDKAGRNDWSGFPALPDGAETVQYVAVQKQ